MKKIRLLLILVCLASIFFYACGDDGTEAEPSKPETEEPSEPEEPSGPEKPVGPVLSKEAQEVVNAFRIMNDSLQRKGVTKEKFAYAKATIEGRLAMLASEKEVVRAAFDLIRTYEKSPQYGPLFINEATRNGLPRTPSGKVIHYFMVNLQQAVIDKTYNNNNLERFRDVLQNARFETCRYFPGDVKAPVDTSVTYRVKINASNAKSWGAPVMIEEYDARRPTGCYAAPGSYVTVKVPASMVRQGYKIRVNAHSWDNKVKKNLKRLDRVSLVYPILKEETVVANPLGGGIYIDVPYLKDLGIVEIEIKNAVRSPFFSSRSWDKMTLEEWKSVQRKYPAPWADFESDKIMINLPTNWISNFDDPQQTMDTWDKGASAVIQLRGLDSNRLNKTLLFMQVDIQMRGSAFFPGYPQTNDMYNPMKDYGGNNSRHYLLQGLGNYTAWHELGHAILITKFRGETEAIVNFLYVAVYNQKFGVPLNEAFSRSFGNRKDLTLDEISRTWTVTPEFRTNQEMDHSNTEADQMRYQHRGYAKYVEIVDLFGWETLQKFWHNQNEIYETTPSLYPKSVNNDPVDNRIYNLSLSANADLRPLIHFWGIQPVNAKQLEQKIKGAGLMPSAKIYDKLMHYRDLIPKNNAEFREHAAFMHPDYETFHSNKEKDYLFGAGWYYTWKDKYKESHYDEAVAAMDKIIKTYFPDGRP